MTRGRALRWGCMSELEPTRLDLNPRAIALAITCRADLAKFIPIPTEAMALQGLD